jgi:hypothetical protein
MHLVCCVVLCCLCSALVVVGWDFDSQNGDVVEEVKREH